MKKYVLSIDAGTTGVTLLLFDKNLKIKSKEYAELNQFYPKPTWVEHDPIELIKKIELLFNQIIKKHPIKDIVSIGITNQRESIVIWNKKTGLPIYNTIVWQCRRTKDYCKTLEDKNKSIFNKNLFFESHRFKISITKSDVNYLVSSNLFSPKHSYWIYFIYNLVNHGQ